MTPLEKTLTIVLIIGGIFTIIATIPTIINLVKDPAVWSSGILQVSFLVSVIGGLIVMMMVIIMLIFRSFAFLYNTLKKATFTVKLLEESKLNVGGNLLFDVNFSGFFLHGYFVVKIRSPYWEENISYSRYDDVQKLGKMKGEYEDENIKLKCQIPANFSAGEYNVSVVIWDVTTWIFSLKTYHPINVEVMKIKIVES